MIRAMNSIKVAKGAVVKRSFSTVPPKHPSDGGKDSSPTGIYVGAGLAFAVTFAAYKLETDPQVAASWKDTPGVGLLGPLRMLFREVPKDVK